MGEGRAGTRERSEKIASCSSRSEIWGREAGLTIRLPSPKLFEVISRLLVKRTADSECDNSSILAFLVVTCVLAARDCREWQKKINKVVTFMDTVTFSTPEISVFVLGLNFASATNKNSKLSLAWHTVALLG